MIPTPANIHPHTKVNVKDSCNCRFLCCLGRRKKRRPETIEVTVNEVFAKTQKSEACLDIPIKDSRIGYSMEGPKDHYALGLTYEEQLSLEPIPLEDIDKQLESL